VDIGNPYDLRHSAASLWLHEGTNAVQVASWMGQSRRIFSSLALPCRYVACHRFYGRIQPRHACLLDSRRGGCARAG
jgi:hypothetical protein